MSLLKSYVSIAFEEQADAFLHLTEKHEGKRQPKGTLTNTPRVPSGTLGVLKYISVYTIHKLFVLPLHYSAQGGLVVAIFAIHGVESRLE